MIISRVKAGWLMIGGSIILFGLVDILPEAPGAVSGLESVLFLVSIGLIIIGIYFLRTAKPCRICGEQVQRSDRNCKYCGYVFKDSPPNTSQQHR